MHNSDAISILKLPSDNPYLLLLIVILFSINTIHRVQIQLFLKLLFLSSEPPQTRETFLEIDSWAEMSVRAQKSGFMVETPYHYNFGTRLKLCKYITVIYIYT